MFHKATTFDAERHILPKYAQDKLDGHRLLISKEKALTTSANDIYAQVADYLWMEPIQEFVKSGGYVDGELYDLESKCAETIKTQLANNGPLAFCPFASSLITRNADLLSVEVIFTAHGIYGMPSVLTIPVGATVETLLELSAQSNSEGWILKDGNYTNWYKLKRERTIDLIVTGIVPGKGKYLGCVGSFVCCTTEGYEVATAGGMADDLRSSIDVIGRVVEIKYQRVGSQGRLRHPRFKRWRDDKLPNQCSIYQDLELAAKWTN